VNRAPPEIIDEFARHKRFLSDANMIGIVGRDVSMDADVS